jgi:HSP20 family protein
VKGKMEDIAMNIARWKNFQNNPFLSLQTELNKAMRDFDNLFESSNKNLNDFSSLTLSPAIDVVEDKDSFKVEVEMPGIGEEDIKINVSNGLLTIKGEKTTSKKDKDKNYISREISYGSYVRTIALPDFVDIDKAKASFKKGMVWVNLPKKADVAKQSREIKIEKSAS